MRIPVFVHRKRQRTGAVQDASRCTCVAERRASALEKNAIRGSSRKSVFGKMAAEKRSFLEKTAFRINKLTTDFTDVTDGNSLIRGSIRLFSDRFRGVEERGARGAFPGFLPIESVRGLAQSKTLRAAPASPNGAPASWRAVPMDHDRSACTWIEMRSFANQRSKAAGQTLFSLAFLGHERLRRGVILTLAGCPGTRPLPAVAPDRFPAGAAVGDRRPFPA